MHSIVGCIKWFYSGMIFQNTCFGKKLWGSVQRLVLIYFPFISFTMFRLWYGSECGWRLWLQWCWPIPYHIHHLQLGGSHIVLSRFWGDAPSYGVGFETVGFIHFKKSFIRTYSGTHQLAGPCSPKAYSQCHTLGVLWKIAKSSKLKKVFKPPLKMVVGENYWMLPQLGFVRCLQCPCSSKCKSKSIFHVFVELFPSIFVNVASSLSNPIILFLNWLQDIKIYYIFQMSPQT